MRGEFTAVLDACVLANYALCDTLLRLAETPALYVPAWTDEILAEATRTLKTKLNWPAELVQSWEDAIRTHFEDSQVENHQPLIGAMENDENDRHVLAAAVKAGAQTIVTFNLKHFKAEVLAPWNVEAQHPDVFLNHLYSQNAEVVRAKIVLQAAEGNRTVAELLNILQHTVPTFADRLREEQL